MTTLRHIVTFRPKPGAAPAVETFDRVRPKPLTTRGIVKLLQVKHPSNNEYNVQIGQPVTCNHKSRQLYGHVVGFDGEGCPVVKLHTGVEMSLPNCWLCFWK